MSKTRAGPAEKLAQLGKIAERQDANTEDADEAAARELSVPEVKASAAGAALLRAGKYVVAEGAPVAANLLVGFLKGLGGVEDVQGIGASLGKRARAKAGL